VVARARRVCGLAGGLVALAAPGRKLYVWGSSSGETSPLEFRGNDAGTLSGTWVQVDNTPGGPPSDGAGPGSTGTEGAAVPVALPAEVRELGKEAEGLRADFRERSRALDGRTVRTVDENLAVIDRAIREAEAAYARSPGNAFLERHLVESYRRKVTHLRDAVAVTSWSADE